jgi:hypothetical protein
VSNTSLRNAKEPDLVRLSTRSPGESEFPQILLQQEQVLPQEHRGEREEAVEERRKMGGRKGLPHR